MVLNKVLNFLNSEEKVFYREEYSGKIVSCIKVVVADNFLTGPKKSNGKRRQHKHRYWQVAFSK